MISVGAVWQSDGPPGRDLRTPAPQRIWSQKDYPGSFEVDRTLAGADEPPVIQREVTAPSLPAGQLYDAPRRADIRRDLGAAQLVRKAVSKQPPPVVQHDDELPTEKNPPPHHVTGFRVHRDHGGAQTLPIPADRTVADIIGTQFFEPDGPAETAGPVCGYCANPLKISARVGTTQKRYCSRSHKEMAAQKRKKDAMRTDVRSANN